MTDLFSFIAKPNNYTILHADSLNINDSSPLKFIDGLKFILCIQTKIEFWIKKLQKVFTHLLPKLSRKWTKTVFFSISKSFCLYTYSLRNTHIGSWKNPRYAKCALSNKTV